jgi:hypothetical protein
MKRDGIRRTWPRLSKIIRGVDKVNSDSWFQMVDQAGRATRSTYDPLNIRSEAARLEVRKNFFSIRLSRV